MPENPSSAVPTPPSDLASPQGLSWFMNDFVRRVPGVLNTLLATKDGLALMADDATTRDQCDRWSAALTGYLSLATGTPGPGDKQEAVRQILIEHDSYLVMIMGSGTVDPQLLNPKKRSGRVETVLGVITEADAETGMVGYEMGQLIKAFARYMTTPVRGEVLDSAAGHSTRTETP